MDEERISPNIYYKGTRKGGVSFRDSSFVYHLGLNVHPNPDKSKEVCSAGIHLAKDIQSLKTLCPDAKEVYECRAGVIYGEDNSKIRVGYCFVVRLISLPFEFPLPQNPICGQDWLEKHKYDFTWDDYNKLGITIKTDNRETTIKATMKPKDIRTVISSIR